MKLIVGLGNPGAKYRGTPHNIGFEVVDELSRRYEVAFAAAPADALMARVRRFAVDLVLVKPLTFMNASGRAVGELQRFFKIETDDLLVVADEAQLPIGQLRLRAGGSAGGHNGLRSIIEHVGSAEFPRLRVGVGRGDPRRDLASHVLARPAEEEAETLRAAAILAADAVEVVVTEGLLHAMNRYNNRGPGESTTLPGSVSK